MPLNANEEALLGQPLAADIDGQHQRLEFSPADAKKVGKWTLVALMMNRTIGSGIFLAPHRVLAGAGCVGGALFLWFLGGLLSICGLYVWLECGLSMPQKRVRGESEPRGVPRSGGEKNYLEFMFPGAKDRLPHIRTTCSFAIMFILMYNLSGNAMSLGIQVLIAAGKYDPFREDAPSQGGVVGIAIGTLTFVVLLHAFSRRGGLLVNNIFAIVKVMLLLAIVCLGFAKAGGAFPAAEKAPLYNFTKDAFKTNRTDLSSWSNSLMFCMYTFSGYEQPFYVLAESKSPRKYFPKYTILALCFAIVLFLLVNISYLFAVPKDLVIPNGGSEIPPNIDMATLFFGHLFVDKDNAVRAMAAMIALSIFGNLIVVTFTAARVKQEIAKEGILPWSLNIATSYTTPYSIWKKWGSQRKISDEEQEHAPTAAFALHWFSSVFLILITLPIDDPRKSYSALVSLYSYTIILLQGCWVSLGLLRMKYQKQRWHWQERRRYAPWLSPWHVIIYGVACAFMAIAAFVPPPMGSPYHISVTGFEWYIVPVIGITGPFWGILYYWGLLAYQRMSDKQLVVNRTPFWMKDPDYPSEYIQKAEIIEHVWQKRPRAGGDHGFTQDEGVKGAVMRERAVTPSEDNSDPEFSAPFGPPGRTRDGFGTTTMNDGRQLRTGFDE